MKKLLKCACCIIGFFIKFGAEIIKTLNYGITIRRILENQDG